MQNYDQYLHEKYWYTTKEIKNIFDIESFKSTLKAYNNKPYICYDTETTGLNHMLDTPFLFIVGFNKFVYYCDIENKSIFDSFIKNVYDCCIEFNITLYAHNAKYDWHMLYNNRTPIPKEVNLADTMTIARLINSCDSDFSSIKLESVGAKYVDSSAKFAQVLIKDKIKKLTAERKKAVCNAYKEKHNVKKFSDAWTKYVKRVRFINDYDEVFEDFKEPTYYDVYLEHKEIMVKYAIDDVVIMLEFLRNTESLYNNLYLSNNGVNRDVINRENKLIYHIANLERVGFCVDKDYLVTSYNKLKDYQEELYTKLHLITETEWKVGQHNEIIKFFKEKYNINLESADKRSISALSLEKNEDVKTISKLICKLRTVDKWISTYVIGVLNRIVFINGEYRLFTTINNNGTVSGRVTSNLQQMPKFGLINEEGEELFHPRRFVIAGKNKSLWFLDYSQVELRVQAYYTILVGAPDYNLCRAYMPYGCINSKGEHFDYKNSNHVLNWDNKDWYNKDGTEWKPTDLHSATTKKAFPELDEDSHEFKKARNLGKTTNFAKNYGAGAKTLAINLDIDMETAEKLSQSYIDTFPGVLSYNKKVYEMLNLKGFVESLYGRRYYINESKNYYKGGNYLIQGSAADLLKEAEIKIGEYLEDKQSKMIMLIHDEIAFEVVDGEEYIIPIVKGIMEEAKSKIPYIPLVCSVDKTTTNWGILKD